MREQRLYQKIDALADKMKETADYMFDHPELSGEEREAQKLLTSWLTEEGFTVELGVGAVETSFKAVFQKGSGGPNIGLLCEYDALAMGHGCGHHLQGPAIIAAAAALKEAAEDEPFTVTVYGTPAEERIGGKIIMQNSGCFRELDVALMYHAGPTTTTDVKCMALNSYKLRYHGVKAHAAMSPEKGRSALDAMLLTFNAVEYMREHVKEDTRMHYTITNAGGPDNVVPDLCEGTVTLRSYSRPYLNTVAARFKNIVKGAELMTETRAELIEDLPFDSKIPVLSLNQLLMEKARALEAPAIRPSREKTGSTDFGNVMFHVPGSCIRVAFVPEGTSSHSDEFIKAGKSKEAHLSMELAAKILAASARDMICRPEVLKEIKEEFQCNKRIAETEC